ncbi:MAG TPA: glycosyl hydrolase [Vicinamibacteria bacterium]|nr:glycosyl hydrolase [Vicinamibacteria bacterium]
MKLIVPISVSVSIALSSAGFVLAQGSYRDYEVDEANVTVDPGLFESMKYRGVEFLRGGRSTAVTGVAGQPLVYYFGGTGGGVFKTSDAGNTWKNVTDGFLGVGSIGAIAVAPSDPNVIYVGTGSACPRGNISVGDGVYKSTDAGKTWKHIGLEDAGQIGKIRVHPTDPDRVYVAALGHIFGPNEERGVFRSTDGGANWEKVLFIGDRTGVVDLAMSSSNPRILFAGAWRAERKPWTLISGSEDGGIYRSTDAGDTWKKLEGGLPEGLIGKTSVSVSPANGNRVWVLLEAEGDKGGVYRSDDGGDSWSRINGEANLRQRPWYYIHIFADPKDENTVYALNTGFYKSIDGGKTFGQRIQVPHGDNHDLWINPENPLNMINSNDGGANVSFDGGETWSQQYNQPTSEIYRVYVDEQWPYRLYGSQQDNSTISVPNRGGSGFREVVPDWYSVGGCESGHIAVDPRDPDIIYAGCYGGSITRVNRKTGETRQILHYPQLQLGQAARDLKYRFQWNAPIRLSPHDPDILYHASQVVHMSRDHGQSWTVISPDLTTDNAEHQDYAGGPITHDSTGVEVYNTVFALEESPHTPGVLWAGSDDGRVHLSRDRGASWKEITPQAMPEGGTVNVIELSAHDAGRAFIAVYRYRENDFRPYIFRTNDYGESWDLLTDGMNGVPKTNFTRAIREDPDRRGLLYAGTEFGMFISFDDGAHWQRFQMNLPVTPITDLRVHRKDLVVATQGRSFWVLDDLTPLHQMTDEVKASQAWLYAPRTAFRGGMGTNATINYYLAAESEESMKLEILDGTGAVIQSFEGKPGEQPRERPTSFFEQLFGGGGADKLPLKKGLNRFEWNLREKRIEMPEGVVHWGGTPGMEVVPGSFQVRLSRGDWSQTQPLEVAINPSISSTVADLRKQYDLGKEIGAEIEALFHTLSEVRDVKQQSKDVLERLKKAEIESAEVSASAKAMTDALTELEEQITQVQSKSNQDPINFPPKIDNQLTSLYGYVLQSDFEPTAGAYERFNDLKPELAQIGSRFDQIVATEVSQFNRLAAALSLPPIVVKQAATTDSAVH